MKPLLNIESLSLEFRTEEGTVKAVRELSLSMERGEKWCLVGESGCGKTVTSLAVMGLLGDTSARITSGTIDFDGQNLLSLNNREWGKIRGRRLGMIFQEPLTALNPVLTVGLQIGEVLDRHFKLSKAERQKRIEELLQMVGIPEPAQRMQAYPHELSGGQRQRVMIAQALAGQPELLIADEPTTALDPTIQAQILDLLRDLVNKTGASLLMITHDLGVVAEMATKVAVMYAGEMVETAAVESFFETPLHPYSQGLMASTPHLGHPDRELKSIPGRVPNLIDLPVGCPFAPRCPKVMERCTTEDPAVHHPQAGRTVRCHLYAPEAKQ